jgi:hypothetical protein
MSDAATAPCPDGGCGHDPACACGRVARAVASETTAPADAPRRGVSDDAVNMIARLTGCPRYDHTRRVCLYAGGRVCKCRSVAEGQIIA